MYLSFDKTVLILVEDENYPNVWKIFQILQRIFDVVQFCRKSRHILDVNNSSRIWRHCWLSGTSIFWGMTRGNKTNWPKLKTVSIFWLFGAFVGNTIWIRFFGNVVSTFCPRIFWFQLDTWSCVSIFFGFCWRSRTNFDLRKLTE
jgi:hypothetical protein